MARKRLAPSGSRPAPRVDAELVDSPVAVTLEPIGVVTLVNVSESGALLESGERPVIGTEVLLTLDARRPKPIEGRIVRTRVLGPSIEGNLRYHVGVAFQTRVPVRLKDGAQVNSHAQVSPDSSTGTTEPANTWW